MIDSNPKDNESAVSAKGSSNRYHSIQENLFQSILSMVLNIIHNSMIAQRELASGGIWNISPLANSSEQNTTTKPKRRGNQCVTSKYGLPVPKHLLQRIDRTSSPAHVGKLRNAIDFITDIETPVL